MTPAAFLLFADCVLVGIGLSYLAGVRLRFEERLAVSAPLGALALGLAGWALSVGWGFKMATLLGALASATIVSLAGWWRGVPLVSEEVRAMVARVRAPWRDPESLKPLLFLLAVAWPLTIRILALAWVTTPGGGLAAGHLATWADGAAHLAYASSIAVGGKVPPGLSTAAGQPAHYHLLADFFGAQVSLLGISMPSALALTEGFLALAFPAIAYLCGVRLTASRGAAFLGVLIFCGGGGLGFVHLVGDVHHLGLHALWHLPRSYARDPDAGLWMDNPTLAYLYAQRNGLFGLPLGLAGLTLVFVAQRERKPAGFVAAGVLVGLLPIANGFAYLIVVAVVAAWALLDRRQPWWRFFGPALVLGLPVARWLQPAHSAVRWLPGWMAPSGLGPWAWFWFRNAGPFIILLVVAGLWKGTVRTRFTRAFAPLWLLWIVPNLVAFHPWSWDNTKYFAFWELFGAFLVGAVLVRVARAGRFGLVACGVAMAALCLSGGLDLYRATDSSVTVIPWTTGDGVRVAVWVRDHVPIADVLAVAPDNTEPVPSLSGHTVVSGYPGWTWDLGIADWASRRDDEVAILRGGPVAEAAVQKWHVRYVVVGPVEQGTPYDADSEWWEANRTVAYRSGAWTVYRAAS